MKARNNLKRVAILVVLIGAVTLAEPAFALFTPSNGQAAKLVLGQPNFNSGVYGTTQRTMNMPLSVAVDPTTHKVFVADTGNNRVLRFASLYALTNGAKAEAVLGQPNFTSHGSAAARNRMYYPRGVFVDAGGRLWVADTSNHRVLRFDHASTKPSGGNADRVLGQLNFTNSSLATARNRMSAPGGVFVDAGGRLWVADSDNSRVLRFDHAASLSSGANASGVLGQPDFIHAIDRTSQNGMNMPHSMKVDSAGRLWVADSYNNRVLRFDNAAAKANGAKANGVLGQASFTTATHATSRKGMYYPWDVAVGDSTGRLFVTDMYNCRILVFNSAGSLGNGANASFVLGQKDFTSSSYGTSATTLPLPGGVFFDKVAKVLFATDSYNNRVLMYGVPSH